MTAPFALAFQRGQAAMQAGDWHSAASAFAAAAQHRPGLAPLRAVLGVALLHCDRLVAAEAHLRAALAADPTEQSAQTYLGVLLNQTDRPSEALALLSPLAQCHPTDGLIQSQLANALSTLGRHQGAATVRQRIAEQTDHPDDWLRAALAWLKMGAACRAEQAIRASLVQDPNRPGARARLGLLLLDRGAVSEAERHFQAALRLRPDNTHARLGLARIAQRQGDLAGAATLLSPLMVDAPEPEVVALWADLQRRSGHASAAIPHLEAALSRMPEADARSLLLHHLAACRDATGDHNEAFNAWEAARSSDHQCFNPERHDRAIAALQQCYAPGRRLAQAGNQDRLPLFIVGMPRSGTSLLEQMLDCHPLLQGIGEQETIRTIAADLSRQLSPEGAPYYAFLDRLDAGLLDAHAEAHLASLRRLATPGIVGLIDKMPHNFIHIGLMGQLFPGARIIHCVRDPVDTCFSCFRQRFGAGLSYTNRLDWLGRFYRTYQDLMAHWRAVAPLPMLEVRYEELVRRPADTLREVLEFVSVPWDARCLQYHQSRRDVGTASFSQVQRPLYTSSIGRAAPYRHRLGPLLRALEGDTLHSCALP